MWQPATERLQHFQSMLKTKLNVLTLRKDPLPTVIFHEPEAIELCSTTPQTKNRTHAGYKKIASIAGISSICTEEIHPSVFDERERDSSPLSVSHNSLYFLFYEHDLHFRLQLVPLQCSCVTYLGKVTISGTHFLSGCTESAVVGLWDTRLRDSAQEEVVATAPCSALLEIRPFQVRLHHLDGRGEATVAMDTYQVARIAYCTADHQVSPNVFAWIYRQINDDLTFQMDCHAVECESKMEAKKLAHSMMEAFKKTFQSMRSDGRIHKSGSSEEIPEDSTPDDG